MGLSGDDLAAWVKASCEAQGIEAKITDAAVVAELVVLLTGEAGSGPRASARRPDPPEDHKRQTG